MTSIIVAIAWHHPSHYLPALASFDYGGLMSILIDVAKTQGAVTTPDARWWVKRAMGKGRRSSHSYLGECDLHT